MARTKQRQMIGDAEIVLHRTDGDFADWIRCRRQGLGGTDAAALIGANPYKSVTSLFFEKMATMDEPVQMTPSSEAAYWGRRLEAVVAEEFSRRTGLPICPANVVLRSLRWPWMLATPDFFVLDPASHEDELLLLADSFLECKTTAWYLGRHWKAGVLPPYVEAQVNHYLAVTGFSHAWAAVLIGGQSFVHIRVERDEAVLTALAETERRFWEYVRAGEMPPDPFTLEPGVARERFDNGEVLSAVALPDVTREMIQAYFEYAELRVQAEARCAELFDQLGHLMYGARVGLLEGEPVLEWSGARNTRQLKIRRLDDHA